jgi:hypothetical protein
LANQKWTLKPPRINPGAWFRGNKCFGSKGHPLTPAFAIASLTSPPVRGRGMISRIADAGSLSLMKWGRGQVRGIRHKDAFEQQKDVARTFF